MPKPSDINIKPTRDETYPDKKVVGVSVGDTEEEKLLKLLPYCRTNTFCHGLLERDGVVYKFLSTNGSQYDAAQVTLKSAAGGTPFHLSEREVVQLRSLLLQ